MAKATNSAWADYKTNRSLYGDGNGQLRQCLLELVDEAVDAVGGIGAIRFSDGGHLVVISEDSFTTVNFYVNGGRINELFWSVECRDMVMHSEELPYGIAFSGYMGMEPLNKMVWLMGCAKFMAVSEPRRLT